MQENTLNVVLCWHMHQPQYRSEGTYTRPWTWLHAIKDYSDMAAHIEAVPGARAVVNFSPHLMVQIEDYACLIGRFLEHGERIGDRILDALGGVLPTGIDGKKALVKSCLRSHDINIRQRFEPYNRLCGIAEYALQGEALPGENELSDLLAWYCLAWMGEFARRESPLVVHLMEQGGNFSVQDRLALLGLIGEEIGRILPRYRKLAEEGKVELSVTPWSHPILPLLMDFASAGESMPDIDLPARKYPGGEARCDWQLQQAIEYFERHFGFRPAGCWPSEGGLSQQTLELLMRHGFRWTASGTNVLRNSLGDGYQNGSNQHQLWSDLPGFTYSNWRAGDAVNDLIHRLEQIRKHCAAQNPTVSIIMDGENAWEYYPENGREFLSMLYTRLADHPGIRLGTFSGLLETIPLKPLPRLVAGSWVYGNFSVWIGHRAKNRAWELLIDAREAVDKALASNPEKQIEADRINEQLSVCESSDWFWWLGEEGRAEDGPAFDELFRTQLKALYRLAGVAAPAILDQPIDDTHTSPQAGDAASTMRQANPNDMLNKYN
jgi:alpha-amylase/alpha-mannosidase (GH57 family)